MISRMNWAISMGMLNHDIMNEARSNFANLGLVGGEIEGIAKKHI